MKVAVHDIRKGPGLSTAYDFEGDYQFPGIQCSGPVSVHLKLTNAGSRIVVEGPLVAPIELGCSRCGEAFSYRLETDVEEHFLPAGSDEATTAMAAGGGVLEGVFTFENDTVELDEVLRQEIVAATPMQVLCKKSCKGLCSGCGTNLNRESCQCKPEVGDPRWAALLDINGKSKKEKRSR